MEYKEGIFVGYRYYDKKKMDVLFPFGHGLSYTTFGYSNLKLSADRIKDTEKVTVSVDITNTGDFAGKEVVQLYVADEVSTVIRPEKELKDFAKVELKPGETKTVTFTLGKRSFAYYNTDISDWHVESGNFRILIGKSSRDIVLEAVLYVDSTVKLPIHYTMDSTVGDILADPDAAKVVEPLFANAGSMLGGGEDGSTSEEAISKEMVEAMMRYMPLRGILSFAGDMGIDAAMIQGLIDQLNGK